ncbi:MAG: helix-turn-helix transcriptional regulator [Treponema sp.]|nr:helix-turn-helix transcriptional regulator [Treponema sp.]
MDNSGQYGVHRRIKKLRHTLKLSQVKFAAAIFISNGYLAKIELEHCPVNERLISLISSKFDVNDSWLRSGEGAMFKRAAPGTSAEKQERMIKVFNELYPNFQDHILKQMEELLVLQDSRKG